VNISQPLKVDILGPGQAPARPRAARCTGRWPHPVRHSRPDDVGVGLPESQNTERQDFDVRSYPWSGPPISSGMSRSRSRGGLEVVPGDYRAARGGARLAGHDRQETPAALAPAGDGSVPRAYLLWVAAFLLLEVIAADAPGDPDAAALALVRDLGLLGEVKRSAPPSARPPWPGEPLTQSETRMLRYLPTHLGVPEIAAELYLSANTVKTHLRHLYRKLGAHSRQEAVQRARALGLLTASSRRT
jgi:DNA-binding CsgD family transcriptional regulator